MTVTTADGVRRTRELRPANGYLAQSDPRLHFGLGDAAAVRSVTVRWPRGTVEEFAALELDRYHRLVEPAS